MYCLNEIDILITLPLPPLDEYILLHFFSSFRILIFNLTHVRNGVCQATPQCPTLGEVRNLEKGLETRH